MQNTLGLLSIKAESCAGGFTLAAVTAPCGLWVPAAGGHLLPSTGPHCPHGAGSGYGCDWEAGATTGLDARVPLGHSFGSSQEQTHPCCPTGGAPITFPQQDWREITQVLHVFSTILFPKGKIPGGKSTTSSNFHPGDEGAAEKLQEGPCTAWAPS